MRVHDGVCFFRWFFCSCCLLATHTATAHAIIDKSKDAIASLRDGDWRAKEGLPPAEGTVGLDGRPIDPADAAAADAEAAAAGPPPEDTRLEGTAVYLSPEVIRGADPSTASDCWALGCVLYQCLTGRPPVWAETEPDVLDKIVTFDVKESFPADFPPEAKDLVVQLLHPDPTKRLGCGADGVMAAAVRVRRAGRLMMWWCVTVGVASVCLCVCVCVCLCVGLSVPGRPTHFSKGSTWNNCTHKSRHPWSKALRRPFRTRRGHAGKTP